MQVFICECFCTETCPSLCKCSGRADCDVLVTGAVRPQDSLLSFSVSFPLRQGRELPPGATYLHLPPKIFRNYHLFYNCLQQIVRPANSRQVLDQIFSQNPWSYLSCQLPIKIILIHFWISKGDQISAGGVLRFVTISDTISPFLPYLSAREFISGK